MIFSEKCMTCARRGTGTRLCDICGLYPDGRRENYKAKKMTNADRIRAMTDEELARFIGYYGCPPNTNNCCPKEFAGEDETDCEACWLKWLKEEAEE